MHLPSSKCSLFFQRISSNLAQSRSLYLTSIPFFVPLWPFFLQFRYRLSGIYCFSHILSLRLNANTFLKLFFAKVKETIRESSNSNRLICLYTAYSNTLCVSEFADFVQFVARDFDTAIDSVRIVLKNCFFRMMEIDRPATISVFETAANRPWHFPLKRFVLPALATAVTPGVARAILEKRNSHKNEL
jgi:hypothetical protein